MDLFFFVLRQGVGAALLTVLLAAGVSCGRAATPPNVVLFVIDTMRADRLGAYGYEDASSPAIDALALESALFEHAYAPAPWTLPSTVSLLTSTHPCDHGVLLDGQKIDSALVPMAERFKAAGYATASFFANPYAGPMSGLDRGYDHSEGRRFTNGDAVGAWLDGKGDRSFFLYVHNVEPHHPYRGVRDRARLPHKHVNQVLDSYRALTRADWSAGLPLGTKDNTQIQQEVLARLEELGPVMSELYDVDVGVADRRMGSVIEALKSRGLWDDTVFVLVSDHGEEFGEHGGWQHDQSLYNELLRVPLLIHLPRGEHGGRRLEGAVSLLDVLPTLADILDRPELARGASGASLLPMLEGESAASEARVIGIRANRKKFYRPWKLLRGDLNVAVLSGPWKAIWNAEPDTIELYDLASDAEEQVNLAAAEPERAEALGRIARDGGRGCTPAGGEARERETEIDEATLERLRSLGYAD